MGGRMKFSLLFLALATGISYVHAQGDKELRFDAPAQHFTQSLPLGNGRLGAMVFGGTSQEKIVLNEISMWSGGTEDPNNPDAYKYLSLIQQLLKENRNKEAQEMLQQNFVCKGKGSGHGNGARVKYGCYQVLGDLYIDWSDTAGAVSDYSRVLQLDKALATTSWRRNGVAYKEEVLVSAPQQAIIVRLSSGMPLSFSLKMQRKENASSTSSGNTISMIGQLNGGGGDKGIRFSANAKLVSVGGKIIARENGLEIMNSKECLIIISAATDLNWPNVEMRGPDPVQIAKRYVENASRMSWQQLIKSHIGDYRSYFNRCQFNLDSPENDSVYGMTTANRLIRFASGGRDVQLPVLYFNFGRYLLISSSRPGGLPANLQGLWAEEYQTPWNGDYHLNINIQMNYWPAEKTNLASCHLPLIKFTEQLVKPGALTAKAYYNSDGWVAHVISNPWKFTAPGEGAEWGSTLSGGAWLCEHLWQHYQYNPDLKYLAQIYPVLKGAVQFYTNILIEDPETGWLVTAPSNSPENSFITTTGFVGQTTMGPTMDMQIGRELLNNAIHAATILGVDQAWRDSMQKIKTRLRPNQVSELTGGIQEWVRDYKEAEPTHRHISHLYGLFPYDEINEIETPALMAAASKTLLRRGDEGTGWSRAWKVAFWARMGDGDHALKVLRGLLNPAFATDTKYTMRGAGTYPNLFCAHPPFQIDGNLGATAAIAEMLLQSKGANNIICFLPALPSTPEWSKGRVEGLCLPYGFVVDFEWNEGKLKTVEIDSKYGYTCHLKLPAGMSLYNSAGIRVKFTETKDDIVVFSTNKNEKYFLR